MLEANAKIFEFLGIGQGLKNVAKVVRTFDGTSAQVKGHGEERPRKHIRSDVSGEKRFEFDRFAIRKILRVLEDLKRSTPTSLRFTLLPALQEYFDNSGPDPSVELAFHLAIMLEIYRSFSWSEVPRLTNCYCTYVDVARRLRDSIEKVLKRYPPHSKTCADCPEPGVC